MTEEHAPDENPVVGDPPPRADVLLSNGAYDKLRLFAVVLLPALGTLYFGLAGIWGLPKAEEVVGTIVVLDTFLGVVLQISRRQYENSDARFDGNIRVAPGEDENTTLMDVSLDPTALGTKKEITVKVDRE